MASFIWTRWNENHIAKHAVTPAEAEFIIENAVAPYPAYLGSEKFLVRGQTNAGRYLQVIYVMESAAGGIDWEEVDLSLLDPGEEACYIIHSRPLTARERANFRKHRRR